MITVLLQEIIDFLNLWVNSWNSHVQTVAQYLGLIEEDTSNLPDIKSNTDDIKDNTAAVITPINNIKTNTDSLVTSSSTTASNTTIIKNNIGTIATNTGSAAAFAEDCANNTLDIKDKVTTIASDTTNIRATDTNIYGAVNDIKDLMQYYFLTNIVTEEIEGSLCNFDTDIEDYLQKAVVTIPADAGGYTDITFTKCGKNILNYQDVTKTNWAGTDSDLLNFINRLPAGSYNIQFKFKIDTLNGSGSSLYGVFFSNSNNAGNINARSTLTTPVADTEYAYSLSFTIDPANAGNFTNAYFYCGRSSSADTVTFYDFMVSVSSAVEPFEAYKENTYLISFGSTITDGAEVDLLSGMVTINTTPVTYSTITPIAIRTYKGVNNIYSDIGSTDVIYRETLKHYLDKNNQ